jgi:hypothetical protein
MRTASLTFDSFFRLVPLVFSGWIDVFRRLHYNLLTGQHHTFQEETGWGVLAGKTCERTFLLYVGKGKNND